MVGAEGGGCVFCEEVLVSFCINSSDIWLYMKLCLDCEQELGGER